METRNFVEYELSDPVSDQYFVTDSLDEALTYFAEGWIVSEYHITISKPSVHTSTRVNVAVTWNNNPDFEKE